MNADGSISRNDFENLQTSDHDEVLFDHDGVMKVVFKAASSNFLSMIHLNDESKEVKIEVPRGQWVYLHAEHTENDFAFYIRLYSGQVLRASSKRTEYTNKPNYKTSSRISIA